LVEGFCSLIVLGKRTALQKISKSRDFFIFGGKSYV